MDASHPKNLNKIIPSEKIWKDGSENETFQKETEDP